MTPLISRIFSVNEPLPAAFRPQGDAFALELAQIGYRFRRAIKQPIDLVVDASQRQQIQRLRAVRNAALHDTCRDAGMRVVEKREISARTVGQAHIDVHAGARKDRPIAVADSLVDLISLARGDCDFLRRRGNQNRQRQPDNGRRRLGSRPARRCQRLKSQHEYFVLLRRPRSAAIGGACAPLTSRSACRLNSTHTGRARRSPQSLGAASPAAPFALFCMCPGALESTPSAPCNGGHVASGSSAAPTTAARGLGVLRIGKDNVDRALFHDFTAIHHQHSAAQVTDNGKIVGNEQHGETELGAQPLQKFSSCAWIETSRPDTISSATKSFGNCYKRAPDVDRWRWPPQLAGQPRSKIGR